ncbi:MAG: hypothetical protein COB67_13900, partial [SAR324 cluster bacterium]
MQKSTDTDDLNYWEERADDISDEHLSNWTAQTEEFKKLVKKVERPGAILFEGPRGSGKTHLFRYTYNQCIASKRKPLPIYVSFGKYYFLEPLLNKKANARKIFHTWVLCKIILGLEETLEKLSGDDKQSESWFSQEELEDISYFKNNAEKGDYISNEISEKVLREIHIDGVMSRIKEIIRFAGRKRAILLLDDAALTFTPEYLPEFFDIFRNLKSTKISPKGTVYSGSTEYGPRFHIGQDAKIETIWEIDSEGNNRLLQQIAEVRLKHFSSKISENILKLMMKASFGIPRAFINMVNIYSETEGSKQVGFNTLINNQVIFLRTEYRTLSQKMPQFESIIKIGEQLFEKVLDILTNANLELSDTTFKQILIGFENSSKKDLLMERMLRFLVEAGLLFPIGDVRHGPNRVYERYIPHLAFLINKQAFSRKNRRFNVDQILEILERSNAKHPEWTSLEKILGKELLKDIKLILPPCSNCNARRLTETQKFCHECGDELVNESKFKKCMEIPFSQVPSIPKR